MSVLQRARALSVLTVLALGLVACGGSSGGSDGPAATKEPQEELAVYEVEVQKPFEGHEVRDDKDLKNYVDYATKTGKARATSMADDAEEAELAASHNADFKAANEAYKSGDYDTAEKGYKDIIKDYPMHYGANVNLTLALLQQDKGEADALKQALLCVYLFPKEDAPLLNVQVAGVACGFSTDDLEDAMNDVASASHLSVYHSHAELSSQYKDYFTYNELWDRMETELHSAAEEEGGDASAESEDKGDATTEETEAATEAEEAEVAAAAEAEAAAEEGSARESYKDINEKLTELIEKDGSDKDVLALDAYLYAVGLQLGYEVDPYAMEPMTTMPYIAVDDEYCKIRIVEIVHEDNAWDAIAEITNKTEDKSLVFKGASVWTINGEQADVTIEERRVQHGDTIEMRLHLLSDEVTPEQVEAEEAGTAEDSEDESSEKTDEECPIKAFTGVLTVEEDTELARYPLSWKASE